MAAVKTRKLSANQERIINVLFDNGPQTRIEIGGVFNETLNQMEAKGIVKKLKATVKHTDENGEAKCGRPMSVWTLTDNTKRRVKRQRAQVA